MSAFKRLLSISLAIATISAAAPLLTCCVKAEEHATSSLSWSTDLSKSIEQAKKSNKYVLADVYTDWCGWCKVLDKKTFADAEMVKYLNEHFVCVKLNAEDKGQGQKAAEQNSVEGYPCGLVFNSSGKMIGKISGYKAPADYQQALNEIIQHAQ